MILQYSNLYPMTLWIGSIDDMKKAIKLFTFYYDVDGLNNDEEPVNMEPVPSRIASGITYLVRCKKTEEKGCLVLLNMEYLEEGDYTTILDTVSHEASHVVDAIYQVIHEQSGTYDSGNEPHAYLTGWVAGCMGDYLTKYFKKINERKEV